MRFSVVLEWSWGSGVRFNESERWGCEAGSLEAAVDQADTAARRFVAGPRFARFAFDCARVTHPLRPAVLCVTVTPVGEAATVPLNGYGFIEDEAIEAARLAILAGRPS